MTREAEIAWAAGLFEGEGCMAWTTGRWHLPRVVMAMTDRDVVERFAEVVGVGTIREVRTPRKPIWKWTACSDDAVLVMRLFLPYFGERRADRAFALLFARALHIDKTTLPRACASCEREFKPEFSSNAARQKFCSAVCRERGAVHAGH